MHDLSQILHIPGNDSIACVMFTALRYVGLNTGIPRVGFSHTVPEPAHTVTCHGYTRTRTVIHAGLYETHGLFSLKYVMYIFICKYN